MSLVLASLFVLLAGAVASLALFRAPRTSLVVSMLAMCSAAISVVIASIDVLLDPTAVESQEFSWRLPMGSAHFSLDGLSAWFLMTIGVLGFCVAPYAAAYMQPSANRKPVALFGALMCALTASLVLVVCAADAVMFLVGWETMTLSAFFLVGFDDERTDVRRGAWMYLIATHIGTAICVLPMFGVIAANAGTAAFSGFRTGLAETDRAITILLFALGVIGFGTKAGILPMHVWLPAAHPVAPTPVSALLSGIVVKTGVYGMLRTLTWLPPLPPACARTLLVIAIASGLMGVLYALAQHDIKRLLAYHTVENIGIIFIGIAVGMFGQSAGRPGVAVLGYTGALLHVTNHAIFKGLLFLSAGAVLHATGTAEIERLGGLARRTPINAAMFLTGAVAICGLPPLNGFVSEWVIYGALFSGALDGARDGSVSVALGILSLALMGGLALACFVKVFGVVFLGRPRDGSLVEHPVPAAMTLAMAVLATLCFVIGFAPGLWVPLASGPVGELVGVSADEFGSSSANLLAQVSGVSATALVLVVAAAGLVLLRSNARRSTVKHLATATVDTWGCGYSRPTPRMQYSATSFASPLITSFRGLLWPERNSILPASLFPDAGHVETHVADLAERDIFRPMFRGVARVFAMIKTVSWSGTASVAPTRPEAQRGWRPLKSLASSAVWALRRGAIHVHLSLIVLTLVIVLLVEGLSGGRGDYGDSGPDRETTIPAEVIP